MVRRPVSTATHAKGAPAPEGKMGRIVFLHLGARRLCHSLHLHNGTRLLSLFGITLLADLALLAPVRTIRGRTIFLASACGLCSRRRRFAIRSYGV